MIYCIELSKTFQAIPISTIALRDKSARVRSNQILSSTTRLSSQLLDPELRPALFQPAPIYQYYLLAFDKTQKYPGMDTQFYGLKGHPC